MDNETLGILLQGYNRKGYFDLSDDRFWSIVAAQTLGDGPMAARRAEIDEKLAKWHGQGRFTVERAARLYSEMYWLAFVEGDILAEGYDGRDIERLAKRHGLIDAIARDLILNPPTITVLVIEL